MKFGRPKDPKTPKWLVNQNGELTKKRDVLIFNDMNRDRIG